MDHPELPERLRAGSFEICENKEAVQSILAMAFMKSTEIQNALMR